MIEYLTVENAELGLKILGLLFPVLSVKVHLASKVLKEVSEMIRDDPQANHEHFNKAVDSGRFHLAKHLNKTLDRHIDYSKGEK